MLKLYIRATLLRKIISASPIPVDRGNTEVHILLGRSRRYEGMWAAYSLAFFSSIPLRLTIHDDGSLKTEDFIDFRRLFPGVRIIPRNEADGLVTSFLYQNSLRNCARLRENFVLSLKLFDPIILSERDDIVVIDSDVLFFRTPQDLLQDRGADFEATARCCTYLVDIRRRHNLTPIELSEIAGILCIERFNSGILRFQRQAISLSRIEHYLNHPKLMLEDGTASSHYSEQTVYALEFSRNNAEPLPETYAIFSPDPHHLVSGHYCGGGYWASLFYIRGLPFLKTLLLNSRS